MAAGNVFSLDVLAYEFTLASDKYDANWLQVRIRAQTDRHGVDTEHQLELDSNEQRRQEILTSLDALISRFPERAVLA